MISVSNLNVYYNLKKISFLTEKRIFEILPLFFAITVVTFPRLPGLLNKTTTILEFDTVSKLF